MAFGRNHIRNIVLNYDSEESVGEGKLYIKKEDLSDLGKVRGTDKKPCFEIEFEDQNNGTIKDGGTMVKFSSAKLLPKVNSFTVTRAPSKCCSGKITEISTDQGGEYFKKNLMGIRGLTTANADLTVWHGMQLIKQAGG